jgi:antitoxin VapB
MGTPQLNIKDAEATRLVRELAELTGESQTEVVRKALRQRLDREQAERETQAANTAEDARREFERIWPEIRKIQAKVRKHMKPSDFLTDDDLYDESGLPR